MINDFALGDHVIMRKPHACGGNEWLIIRNGADIKLKCMKCAHIVMLDRCDFIRAAKRILPIERSENPIEEKE